MTNLTDWLTQARDRADATKVHPGDEYKLIADLDGIVQGDHAAAPDAIQAVRDVAAGYQAALDEDGQMVALDRRNATEEILRDLRGAIAAALGVSEP